MAAGWWAGFAILVLGLDLHMTPPRGDNWAGCLGMTIAVLGYCRWIGLGEVARAGLVCGFLGGIGFAAASMLKLVEVTSGWRPTGTASSSRRPGLFNGIALAVAMASLSRWNPPGRERRRPAAAARDRADGAGLRRAGDHLPQPAEERRPVGQVQGHAAGDGGPRRQRLVRPGLPPRGIDPPGPRWCGTRGVPWRSCRRARWAEGNCSISCCSGGWSSATSNAPWSPSRPAARDRGRALRGGPGLHAHRARGDARGGCRQCDGSPRAGRVRGWPGRSPRACSRRPSRSSSTGRSSARSTATGSRASSIPGSTSASARMRRSRRTGEDR